MGMCPGIAAISRGYTYPLKKDNTTGKMGTACFDILFCFL